MASLQFLHFVLPCLYRWRLELMPLTPNHQKNAFLQYLLFRYWSGKIFEKAAWKMSPTCSVNVRVFRASVNFRHFGMPSFRYKENLKSGKRCINFCYHFNLMHFLIRFSAYIFFIYIYTCSSNSGLSKSFRALIIYMSK